MNIVIVIFFTYPLTESVTKVYGYRIYYLFIRILNYYRIFAILFKIVGTAKTEEFTVKDNKIAQYAKALAHPARVAILQLLIKKQACICGDIVDEIPLSQSTVSQHLKELREAGLIKGDIDGKKICYCINEVEWEVAKGYMENFFKPVITKDKCC
jgi:ArsR family transcriptional regulator